MTSLPAQGTPHGESRPLSDDELLPVLDDPTHPQYQAAWVHFVATIGEKMLRFARVRFPQDVEHHEDWVQDVTSALLIKFPSTIDGGWNGLQKYALIALLNRARSQKRRELTRRNEFLKYAAHDDEAVDAAVGEDPARGEAGSGVGERFRGWLERVAVPKLRREQRAIVLAMLAGDSNATLCAQLSITPRQLAKYRENLTRRLHRFARKHPMDD